MCKWYELGCKADEWVGSKVGDAIENMANAIIEAFGKAIASLGTMWVHIGTPNLTGAGGTSPVTAGSTAPNAENITTVMGYVTWISLAVAVISLFILGAKIAASMRSGEGFAGVGHVGLVLSAVVLISGASALVAGLMPSAPNDSAGAVLFLQSSLWWYMGAAAVISVIIGGARMAWEQRAEPGREIVKSLLTLVVVAGAGTTIVGLLVTASDSFALWIIDASLKCDVEGDGACFEQNMLALLALTTNPAASSLGSILVIILGLIAIFAAILQIVLMVARGGMLVILTGILPLSASFTNTEMGKGWFKRCISWLTAFLLYKPAAAIIYAASFQLTGTDVFSDDGSGLLAVLTGLMLMVIALFAMPALMRFVTPMVGAMAGGSAGGVLAAGALAGLPTGATMVGRLSSGDGGGSGQSGSQGPSGGREGAHGNGAAPSQGSGQTSSGSSGAEATSGGATQGTGTASTAGSAGGAGVAASGGRGAAAGSGAAAAGAAGPAGIAAGAALEAGKKAGQAAAGAAQSIGEQSTGEGSGPDGSR